MNSKTLSKESTSYLLGSEEAYSKLEVAWRKALKVKKTAVSPARKIYKTPYLRAEVHMLYMMLRGKNWTKGFKTSKANSRYDRRNLAFQNVMGTWIYKSDTTYKYYLPEELREVVTPIVIIRLQQFLLKGATIPSEE